MATLAISFTVPDAHAAAIKDDFCLYHGWTALINGEANPESQNAFIKRTIGQFIKESVRAARVNAAHTTAVAAAQAEVESNVTLT